MASTMTEQTVRVEDYLNDKLQSQADLDNLDALLDSVKHQQELLRKQLQDAETDHAAAHEKSTSHAKALLAEAAAFRNQQTSIDKRMMIITQSETSDDAVRKFDGTMQKLRKLDIAKSYVDLLSEVEELAAEARRNFKTSPEAALKPYIRLQEVARNVRIARPAAEEAAPHLMDHVDGMVRDLWQGMKEAFSSDFEKTLQKMKWPPKDAKTGIHFAGEIAQEWIAGVEKLLELQSPELKDREAEPVSKASEPLVLLPLEVMIKPLALRFRYHFSGDRPTNRRDKPEFFLSHLADLLNLHDTFFYNNLQPLLYKQFKGTSLALNPAYMDSTSALITALLPMLRDKLSELLPQVSSDAQLLSHVIHELMSFDSSLRDDWGYDGGRGADGWKGITSEVLSTWFDRWLEVEKEFALNRYRSIIEQADSGEIDYESVDPGETKPTKAAMRVNDLLETVTDRYRPLQSFSQKLKFLVDIQLAIFDRYHERLASALEAFLAMTSSLARVAQGISREDSAQLRGLGGIERLARIYVSAEYLERKMRDWSDDVFFLELWDELQYRARTKENRLSGGAGNLTLEEISAQASKAVDEDADTGALFDETSAAYHRLRVRTEGVLEEHMYSSVRDALRAYRQTDPWASLSPTESATANTISAEMDAITQLLHTYLSFLARCLAMAPLRRVARHLAQLIQTWLWDNIVANASRKFSTSGVGQLRRDLHALWEVFDQYCRQGYGRSSMPRLAEALELLSLPMNSAEAEAEEEEETALKTSAADEANGNLTLREAEDRIFRSNEDARLVLEELGLYHLSESEARELVGKRIELGN